MTRRIYLDLDGVMADFDGTFPAVFGLDHRDMADDDMWLKINGHPSFFRDLPPMAGAVEFFRTIEHLDPIILTACPKSNYAHVATQKVEWVRAHLSAHVTVLPVLGGSSKPLFMHAKGDILIDDFRRNTEAWAAAGGHAILHRGFEGTAAALAEAIGSYAREPAQPVEAVEVERALRHFYNDQYLTTHAEAHGEREKMRDALTEFAHPRPTGDGRMTVINPEEWQPCTPAFIAANPGGCRWPRVWNEAEQNHYHPKTAPTVEQAGEVVRVDSVAYRYRKRGCGGTWRYGSVSHRNTGRGPDPKLFDVEMLARTEDAQPRPVGVPDGEVILEHSGCGHGLQANQLNVSLYPGDKVLMVRGHLGKAMLAAAPAPGKGGEA